MSWAHFDKDGKRIEDSAPPRYDPRYTHYSWPTSLPGGRINQAPRPEGFQSAITGLADYITGNKWDFDQRGRGGQRQWDAPDDLTVTQGAEQGVRRGGGILDRIGNFLGGLGVPGSPDAPADMQGTQMVRDPQSGEWVHPNVLKHWSRQ